MMTSDFEISMTLAKNLQLIVGSREVHLILDDEEEHSSCQVVLTRSELTRLRNMLDTADLHAFG